jgi:hypothetical protein
MSRISTSDSWEIDRAAANHELELPRCAAASRRCARRHFERASGIAAFGPRSSILMGYANSRSNRVMNEIVFSVQGSAPEPYEVRFIRREGGDLTATCTCPAGAMGQYCKHRFSILSGSTTGIVGEKAGDVATVASWLSGSDVEKALLALDQAERELEAAKKRVSVAKKLVANAMSD